MGRALFIIQFDSFIKTLTPVIKNFIQDNYDCDVILLKKRLKKKWITSEIINLFHSVKLGPNSFYQIYERETMKRINKMNYDLIVIGTSNTRLIEKVKKQLIKYSLKAKIASGYVGALLNNDFESFKKGLLRRSKSDLIWVPGIESKRIVLDVLKDNKIKIIDSGLPRFDQLYEIKEDFKQSHQKDIIFFEQPTFPETKRERIDLVEKLSSLARLNPNTKVIIKPRFKKKVGHAHRPKYLLQNMVSNSKSIPKNLLVSNEDIYTLFKNCKLALTISSTAGLESLLVNIPTYFISDYCSGTNKYGSDDFKHLNATIAFEDIFNNQFPQIDYKKVCEILKFDGNNTKRLSDALKRLIIS
tara:strand:- start:7550 stop:8620 length:1071 start_codon:yes stop_codon:yes gene_type:complete